MLTVESAFELMESLWRNDLPTEAEFANAERTSGIVLPVIYRRFLRCHHGAFPEGDFKFARLGQLTCFRDVAKEMIAATPGGFVLREVDLVFAHWEGQAFVYFSATEVGVDPQLLQYREWEPGDPSPYGMTFGQLIASLVNQLSSR